MDWREIGRWVSSVTFHIVTKYFSTKNKKSLHSSVYLHQGIIEDLWMEVGAMTWMADGCSDREYEKLESEVDRYYIIWLFHIQIAVRISGSKLSQSSVTSDCWVTAEEAWLSSCREMAGGRGVRTMHAQTPGWTRQGCMETCFSINLLMERSFRTTQEWCRDIQWKNGMKRIVTLVNGCHQCASPNTVAVSVGSCAVYRDYGGRLWLPPKIHSRFF